MKYSMVGGALLLMLWVSPALTQAIAIDGIRPDLMLAFIGVVAVLEGPITSSCAGFVGGLMTGVLFGPNLFLPAILYTILGLALGLLGGLFRVNTYVTGAAIVFGASILFTIVMALYAYFVYIEPTMPFGGLLRILLFGGLYTAATSLPIMAVGRVFKRMGAVRKRRMSDLL